MSLKKFQPNFHRVAAAIVAIGIFVPMSVSLSADPDPRIEAQRDAREFASDAMITARVKTALLTDKRIDGLPIDVDTKNSIVTLKGEVDEAAQVDHAEKLAAGVEGVESVSNSLVVGRDPAISDTGAKGGEEGGIKRAVDDGIITGKVKTALIADAEIKGLMIDVDTNRGVVTLSGLVESKSQLDKVMQIAGQTEGVNAVNNQLSVKNISKQSRGDLGRGEMNLASAEAARVHSVDNELMAHRLFDSSPLARYRPLPYVQSPAFDAAMTPGRI